MQRETKDLIDLLKLFPELKEDAKKCGSVDELDTWIEDNRKQLFDFGPCSTWQEIRFYCAVEYGVVLEWLKGEIYV